MPTLTAPDGTELAYRLEGRGEPLLCLPGGPMRASVYLGDLGGLSNRRRLVLLDLRGTGDSAEPADPASYRCDRQVGDIEALRVHLGLDRVDLLAHSAAGDLGLLYALAHPDRVRTLTLVTARSRPLGVEFTREHRDERAALRVGEPWHAEAFQAYQNLMDGSDSDADWEAMTPFFYGRWDEAAREHAAGDAAQTNKEAARLFSPWDAFDPDGARAIAESWDVRVLVVAGELDSAPIPRVGAQIAELFADGELAVQPGGGHFPWLDDPDFFVRTVADFLDR
ncbi:alpha/beta fold hydrolase [Nocardiopsis metallicus]|uniref:Pimeloyl-ACP methyl ester carboxylesterase n=1 Tax=Nocardiopsis metallicus TaxID=179819 RepID=A0A840W0C8_9ACTN|nr:alpha/beta hydrolase [Nocardiopsis metallicus]MBB5489424.1 pimeloyl-ACP methyl ester carboxylesterase [Nocardiopsis metallicus]